MSRKYGSSTSYGYKRSRPARYGQVMSETKTWKEHERDSKLLRAKDRNALVGSELEQGTPVLRQDFTSMEGGNDDGMNNFAFGAADRDSDFSDEEDDGRPRKRHTRNFIYSWSDRLAASNDAWTAQMDDLVEAFMLWERDGKQADDSDDTQEGQALVTNSITTVTMKGVASVIIAQRANKSLITNLVLQGFIPTTPERPTKAVHAEVLELFAALTAQCPSLSAMAFVQAMCAFHRRPFEVSMLKPFGDAFDVFMEIKWRLKHMVDSAIFRTPDDIQRSACAACMYTLDDDPVLNPGMLVAMDGNESLKRVERTRAGADGVYRSIEVPDSRSRPAPFFLEKEFVDEFQNEVRSRRTNTGASRQDIGGDDGASPVDGLEDASPCADNWVNLGSDHKKLRWGIFEETGVFVTVCRHGVVLLCCDMIRSGELAKYPLSHVGALTASSEEGESGPFGRDVMIGYDIACGFQATARASPRLRTTIAKEGVSFCVNAFHGHAHNRQCQLRWHSMYQKGVGIEDFETCERLFSDSNRLARSTRNMSKFHRRQALVQYFMRWNRDRFLSCSSFLQSNFKQATNAIAFHEDIVKRALEQHSAERRLDFEAMHADELAYFTKKKNPDPADFQPLEYVKALEELREDQKAYDLTLADVSRPSVGSTTYRSDVRVTAKAHRAISNAYEVLVASMRHVHDLEDTLGIVGEKERWSESRPEWQRAKASIALDNYRKALDHLEGLVISRFMELSRLNSAGVCYKARRHVVNVVKRRKTAIDTAVKKYNEAARRLQTPRPPLSVEEALTFVTIGHFDLLRVEDASMEARPWTEPAVRAAAVSYYKALRAREELQRVEVEARRILVFYRDLETALRSAVDVNERENHPLAFQLSRRLAQVSAEHELQQARLARFTAVTAGSIHARKSFIDDVPAADAQSNAGEGDASQMDGEIGVGGDEDEDEDEQLTAGTMETLYDVLDDES